MSITSQETISDFFVRLLNISTGKVKDNSIDCKISLDNLLKHKRSFIPQKLFRFRPILGESYRYRDNPLSKYLSSCEPYHSPDYRKMCTRLSGRDSDIDGLEKSAVSYRERELRGNLYCCAPYYQNDPYDSVSGCLFQDSNSQMNCLLDSIIDEYHKEKADEYNKEKIMQLLMSLNDSVTRSVRESSFIACFGEFEDIFHAPVSMWNHYAENYYGCCMEYNTDDWPEYFKDALFPVNYINDLLNFITNYYTKFNASHGKTETSFTINYLYPLMLVKLNHWSYENEWRIIADKRLLINEKVIHKYTPILSDVYEHYSDRDKDELIHRFNNQMTNKNLASSFNFVNTLLPSHIDYEFKAVELIDFPSPKAIYFYDLANLYKLTKCYTQNAIFTPAQEKLIKIAKEMNIDCFRLPVDLFNRELIPL